MDRRTMASISDRHLCKEQVRSQEKGETDLTMMMKKQKAIEPKLQNR